MSYPASIDSFTVKKNKGDTISSEAHTVPGSPYIVEVTYTIFESVSIPGYVEVSGSPSIGEFRVDYGTKNIQFNSGDTSASITVSYITSGSPIYAQDVNSVQSSITNIETTLGVDPQGSFTDVGARLANIESNTVHSHQDWLVPTGTKDGTNKQFTIPTLPNPSTSLEVSLNGINLAPNSDFILSGTTVILIEAPDTTDLLLVKYRI